MDDEQALAALLAEAAGTVLPSQAESTEMALYQQQHDPSMDTSAQNHQSSLSAGGSTTAAPVTHSSRPPVPVSSAFALSLNQYLGQHPVLMQNRTKVFTVYQTYVDYSDISDTAISAKKAAATGTRRISFEEGGVVGTEKEDAAGGLEAGVRYQRWIASCQESLELERLSTVYKDPVAAINASLTRLHDMALLPISNSSESLACAACPLFFDRRDLPSTVSPAEWARSTLENPLARAAYYLSYGPLFHPDSVAAAMGLERKAVVDEPPTQQSGHSDDTHDFSSHLYGSGSELGGLGIHRSEAWIQASERIARDVHDRQAWLTLLASIKQLPLHRVRHIWQAFCFYFPTCGPIIHYYLQLEIALLTGSSNGAVLYGLSEEGLKLGERIHSLQAMNGLKDTDEASAAEANFKAVLRIANCFTRHLPLCSSPALYQLFTEFALNFVPADDRLFGNCLVEALINRVGRLPTSNKLWHSFINVLQTMERRVGPAALWQLYISWGAARPGSERGIDGRTKSGADLVSKIYLRMLTTPLDGRERTLEEYTAFQQRRLGGFVGKLEKNTEISMNAARESFTEGWRMWGELYHGCYEPQLPYSRLIAIPYGTSRGGANSLFHQQRQAALAAAANANSNSNATPVAGDDRSGAPESTATAAELDASAEGDGVAPADGGDDGLIGFGEEEETDNITQANGEGGMSEILGATSSQFFSNTGAYNNNGANIANGQHMSNRPRETPFLPIPCGHRDMGRFEAEEERITESLTNASKGTMAGLAFGGGVGMSSSFGTAGSFSSFNASSFSATAADEGGNVVGDNHELQTPDAYGSTLRPKIAPTYRPTLDAEGLRVDILHWQLWERIINHERGADRLASTAAAHTARVLQFLQWRVAHFPLHAVAHLDLAAFIDKSPTITDRAKKVRDVLENAAAILPESKVLIAEFARLLQSSLADDERGHALFRSAVERGKTRLALFRELPLAAPLGTDFLISKYGAEIGDVSKRGVRAVVSLMTPEDRAQHSKLLALARAQAAESLSLVQNVATWYGLWLQWAKRGFKSAGADHMRLVARHAFGETNLVKFIIHEVQRLYKSLSLPFFVDPSRTAFGALPTSTVPNSALSDMLAVLTSSSSSNVEADTCLTGRGAGSSIVFAPRHHFAALNALCKLWCVTEAVQFQSQENALTIFSAWVSWIRTMCVNTAKRYWNPIDCGVDESIFSAANTLLECRPADKPHVFSTIMRLMSVAGDNNNGDCSSSSSSQLPCDMALRLFMRFDPRNEWGWGFSSGANLSLNLSATTAVKRATPVTINPTPLHALSIPFGPLEGSLITTASAVDHHPNDGQASASVSYGGPEALLLGLAKRWREGAEAFDAVSFDYAPTAATVSASQLVHCDSSVSTSLIDSLIGPSVQQQDPHQLRHPHLVPAADAALTFLERALASSATLPMLTPFSNYVNPRLLSESYLSIADDINAFGTSGVAEHITDLDGNDNANNNSDEAARLMRAAAEEREANRQRDVLLGLVNDTKKQDADELATHEKEGKKKKEPTQVDPTTLNPYNWWAPSRTIDKTPLALCGATDLFAAVPSTVPFAAQGLLDLVRCYAATEHAANTIVNGAAEGEIGGLSAEATQSMLGSIMSGEYCVSRGALARSDVVNPKALAAIDAAGLAQISAALDDFVLPNHLSRFDVEKASAARAQLIEAMTMRKAQRNEEKDRSAQSDEGAGVAAEAKDNQANNDAIDSGEQIPNANAAIDAGVDHVVNGTAELVDEEEVDDEAAIAAAGLEAFTRALIANAFVGVDESFAEPLDASNWVPYRLPYNERYRFMRQQNYHQSYNYRGRGGRGGRGGNHRGRGGGRGGGRYNNNYNNHNNNNFHQRRSLLALADEEERKAADDALAGHENGEDEADATAAALQKRMRLPEGVHAHQRPMSQFSARSFAASPRPYLRSLEFSMDNVSLMLAARREVEAVKAEQNRKEADFAERDRLREERDKRRRADGIYSAPRDSYASALAAASRHEREAAARAAAQAIIAEHNGKPVDPAMLAAAGATSSPFYRRLLHNNNNATTNGTGNNNNKGADGQQQQQTQQQQPQGRGMYQSPLDAAIKTRRRITNAIASRAYPAADAWMPIVPDLSSSRLTNDENSSDAKNIVEHTQQAPPQPLERGNTYFAPLHYLMSCLPRHTLSDAVPEAESVTGAGAYSADDILAILKETPSLRAGAGSGSGVGSSDPQH